ncbi:MAG: Ig-like domain-containing protein [Acidobacteria bacterium]|nr:Ig-like domain-containing protein [Acidobacteriota bacterium]MBW8904901.1 Ig-like domain-containing protein [Betaproteobacteria bacterium]
MFWIQERGQLVNLAGDNPQRSGSLRRAMHVIAGLNWFARLGFTPGAGYSLSMPSDGAGWANAASYVTVTTAAQHFARMISRLATYMVGPDGAGLYHIRMDDYNDLGSFMFGFLASTLIQGFKIFGTPPDGHEIVERTYEYMFTAEQSPGVRLIYPSNMTPGFESFVYSTPIGTAVPSPTSTELNGPHMLALGYLLRTTLAPEWRLRGDVLYAALRNADPAPYFHKTVSETSLHSVGWLADRMTPIPGVTGVLTSAALNFASAALLFVSGSSTTLQLSVVSTLDTFGDPVSQAGMSVAWSSLNTAVATVDSAGLVTTVASGTATIRAAVSIDGTTVNADCVIMANAYLQYADFSGSAGWTLSQSGGTTVNSVTGGELVQTMQNVSVARADEVTGRNCTGRTFMARIAQLPANNTQQKVRAILLDAAGNGLFMAVDTSVLYWGTVTGGYGANPFFTVVGAGTSVSASAAFHFKFIHNSSTDQWTMSYSVLGSTYTTKAGAQTVTMDETTARWCLRSHIAANGTTVNTVRWDSVCIF